MPAIPRLRPLSLSELLDRTFSLYRNHFGLFVGIMLLPQLVLLVFQLAGVVVAPLNRGASAGSMLIYSGWMMLAALLTVLLAAASTAATISAVSAVYLDRPITVSAAYREISSRIVPVMLITIAVGMGIGIGLVLLIVPGIIFALMWSLTIPVVVLEKKGLGEATARSRQLTKGSRGRIFIVCFVIGILAWVVKMLFQVPALSLLGVSIFHGQNPAFSGWYRVAAACSQFFSACLVGPLFTIALSLLYFDERVRKEGFDLQVMMSSMEGALGDSASATAAQ
jgi:hypothetical protein